MPTGVLVVVEDDLAIEVAHEAERTEAGSS
jgi:hypothetical protein